MHVAWEILETFWCVVSQSLQETDTFVRRSHSQQSINGRIVLQEIRRAHLEAAVCWTSNVRQIVHDSVHKVHVGSRDCDQPVPTRSGVSNSVLAQGPHEAKPLF